MVYAALKTSRGARRGGTPHMKGVEMLVVSLNKFRILLTLRVFWAKRHHI